LSREIDQLHSLLDNKSKRLPFPEIMKDNEFDKVLGRRRMDHKPAAPLQWDDANGKAPQ
jgi:hypothetical protein